MRKQRRPWMKSYIHTNLPWPKDRPINDLIDPDFDEVMHVDTAKEQRDASHTPVE